MSNNFENPKVGDKVFVSSRRGYLPVVKTIEEITKSGNLKVDGNIFYPDGKMRGESKKSIWDANYITISPYNEERFQEIQKKRIRISKQRKISDILGKIKLESLSDENLAAFDNFLEKIGCVEEKNPLT